MLKQFSEFLPLLPVLSTVISLASFALAFFAFRRTSRLQDVDYRPHMSITVGEPTGETLLHRYQEGEYDGEDIERQRNGEIMLQGKVANVGPKPTHVLMGRVLLGPRNHDNPEHALTVPFNRYLGAGGECPFDFSLRWGTVWDVSQRFDVTEIECHLSLKVKGADGAEREIKKYLASFMRCEGHEWIGIGPHYFRSVLNDIQQARLRERMNPKPRRVPTPVDPSIPF